MHVCITAASAKDACAILTTTAEVRGANTNPNLTRTQPVCGLPITALQVSIDVCCFTQPHSASNRYAAPRGPLLCQRRAPYTHAVWVCIASPLVRSLRQVHRRQGAARQHALLHNGHRHGLRGCHHHGRCGRGGTHRRDKCRHWCHGLTRPDPARREPQNVRGGALRWSLRPYGFSRAVSTVSRRRSLVRDGGFRGRTYGVRSRSGSHKDIKNFRVQTKYKMRRNAVSQVWCIGQRKLFVFFERRAAARDARSSAGWRRRTATTSRAGPSGFRLRLRLGLAAARSPVFRPPPPLLSNLSMHMQHLDAITCWHRGRSWRPRAQSVVRAPPSPTPAPSRISRSRRAALDRSSERRGQCRERWRCWSCG